MKYKNLRRFKLEETHLIEIGNTEYKKFYLMLYFHLKDSFKIENNT